MNGPQFEEMEPLSEGTSLVNLLTPNIPNIFQPNNNNNNNICIKLEAISNYRSLGGMPIGIEGKYFLRPGAISRSASPTNATVSDEFWLLEILSIKTLVDLRTSWENKTISPVRKFEDNFVMYSIKEREHSNGSSKKDKEGSISPTLVPQIMINNEKEMEEQRNNILWRLYNRNLTSEDLVKLRSHSTGVYRKRYSIPLINNRFFLEGVYSTAPNDTKLKSTVSRYILFNDSIGAFILMNHLNDLGIVEMYKLTLLYTQEELLTIFRILKNKENYPIMYYCSLGKDRTGMVTALLLSVLGVPRDIVIDDYSKSEGNLKASLDQIKKYFTRVGLSKDEFVRSHKSTMEGLLNWVDQTYGSVSNYLVAIGFSLEEQEELKRNLIVSKEDYDRLTEEAINIPDLQQKKDEYIAMKERKSKKSPKHSSSPKVFFRRFSGSSSSDKIPHIINSPNNNNHNNNHNNNNTNYSNGHGNLVSSTGNGNIVSSNGNGNLVTSTGNDNLVTSNGNGNFVTNNSNNYLKP